MTKVFDEIFFEPITKIFIGPKLTLLITDPETIKSVLTGMKFNERLDIVYGVFRKPYALINEKRK